MLFNKNGLRLSNSVGNNLANNLDDVLAVKQVLNYLRRLSLNPRIEPHGYITRDLDNAVKKYQQERHLKIDGRLFPKGETQRALNHDLRFVDKGHDGIESEPLPPPEEPKIPGTDIPDRGIPEGGFPGSDKFDPHRDDGRDRTVPMPTPKVPNPDIDPGIGVPYLPGDIGIDPGSPEWKI